jgi:GT2 family glycosyltransferase
VTPPSPGPKETVLELARVALRSFLDTGSLLDLTPAGPPRVSVLVLVCDRAELTLACLQALALRLHRTAVEVVVVDNGSSDETGEVLERVRGLRVVRNETNRGFPAGVNQAARLAGGKYLLLLNNDAQVLGRSIDVAVDFLDNHPDVGAVGGKIVLLDGRVQEAGCIIRRDGWTVQYGRQASPDDGSVNFRREVDYCSATFLMTPRELFGQLGGLEEAFSPGYFEDPDYCIRLRQAGRRIVYLPEAVVLHYENGTSSTLFDLDDLTGKNQRLFAARHAEWLRTRPAQGWPAVLARTADDLPFTVLLLGDALVEGLPPERALASVRELIARIHALGGFVTLCLTGARAGGLRPFLRHLPDTVEVLCLEHGEADRPLRAAREDWYDLIVAADAATLEPFVTGEERRSCALLRDGRLELLGAREDGPARRSRTSPKAPLPR